VGLIVWEICLESASSILAGIEIGGTKLQLVTGDSSGTIGRRWQFAVDRARGRLGICEKLDEVLREIAENGVQLDAIGVGFGGPIDVRTGVIVVSHQISGWDGFPLRDWLVERALGARVAVENDANIACLGEAVRGAGRGQDPVFYVTMGSGVGGGLVVGGRIYHGLPPGESEFGHLRLDRNGTSVEARCSGWAIDRQIRSAVAGDPSGLLAKLCAGLDGGEARQLAAALDHGDAVASSILRELAADLALGLSHVVHLIHPQVIVLGGGLSLVGEPLRKAVTAALDTMLMDVFRPAPPVRLAALGEDVVPVGALLLAGTT
jgi:glucokinase